MSDVSQVRFVDYAGSIAKALDLIGAKDRLPQSGLIIIKPNLTSADKPSVTTAVAVAEALYEWPRPYAPWEARYSRTSIREWV